MTWVWPITALYRGPVAIGAYRTLGLSGGQRHQEDRGDDASEPYWHSVFKGVTHCGAGSFSSRGSGDEGQSSPRLGGVVAAGSGDVGGACRA